MQRAALDLPVVDQTGLSGRYDFDLESRRRKPVRRGLRQSPGTPLSPVLFAALTQQLGRKLEATRGKVQALVIDRVERPSAN